MPRTPTRALSIVLISCVLLLSGCTTPARLGRPVHDDTTLMTMVPYIRKTMKHVTGTGVRFRTKTEGVGDVRVEGIHTF